MKGLLYSLILAVASAVSTAFAFEIGQINVFYDAKAGEPFYAEIPVTNLTAEDFEDITVKVPPEEDFLTAQLPYGEFEKGYVVNFSKTDRSSGFIIVKNSQSVPYEKINLLIEVVSGISGESKIRKYSTQNLVKKLPDTPQQPTTEAASAPTLPEATAPVLAPAATLSASSAIKMDVDTGDTLENIAQTLMLAYYNSQNVTIEQVMTAFRRQNATILDRDNSYQIQSGVSAFIPNYDQVIAQSAEDAKKEIDTYYRPYFNEDQWKAAFVGTGGGRVRLSSEDDGAATTSETNLANTDSALAQRNAIIKQLNSLDTQLQAMQSQITIKNQQLQELQAQLKQAGGAMVVWGILTGFISDLIEMIKDNPLLWLALSVGLVLVILVFRGALSGQETYYDPYGQSSFDDEDPDNKRDRT